MKWSMRRTRKSGAGAARRRLPSAGRGARTTDGESQSRIVGGVAGQAKIQKKARDKSND